MLQGICYFVVCNPLPPTPLPIWFRLSLSYAITRSYIISKHRLMWCRKVKKVLKSKPLLSLSYLHKTVIRLIIFFLRLPGANLCKCHAIHANLLRKNLPFTSTFPFKFFSNAISAFLNFIVFFTSH
jgi:hypothetical protein